MRKTKNKRYTYPNMNGSNNPEYFVGLDVGTSTVRCVIGMIDPVENKPSIIGHGSAVNLGMRKGVPVHIEDVTDAIVQAVTEAERISGQRIHHATVNVNGAHVASLNSKGVIAISAANREISDEDRLRVEDAATVLKLPPNREIVQFFAKSYSLDGQHNIKDPVGMSGVRLEVDAHIVTAATPALRNLDLTMEKAQITPAHHTFAGLAASEAVLNRQQKEAGTVVLDIGAGTTNLLVIEDGEIQHIAVIPMGGQHITNDLAIGLKTDLDIAEQVKIKHASLSQSRAGSVVMKGENGPLSFDYEEITMIAEARVDELMEYVDKELQRIHRSRKLPGGVVLVGGTAKLPGIAEFTKDRLQLPARLGRIQPVGGLIDTVSDPAYATVVGLMLLDILLSPEAEHQNSNYGVASRRAKGMVDTLLKRLRK